MATVRKRGRPTKAETIAHKVEKLRNLGSPVRVTILDLLSGGPCHVGALLERLGGSQPALSHQLAILRTNGVVETQRDGKRIIYSLTKTGYQLVDILKAI